MKATKKVMSIELRQWVAQQQKRYSGGYGLTGAQRKKLEESGMLAEIIKAPSAQELRDFEKETLMALKKNLMTLAANAVKAFAAKYGIKKVGKLVIKGTRGFISPLPFEFFDTPGCLTECLGRDSYYKEVVAGVKSGWWAHVWVGEEFIANATDNTNTVSTYGALSNNFNTRNKRMRERTLAHLDIKAKAATAGK